MTEKRSKRGVFRPRRKIPHDGGKRRGNRGKRARNGRVKGTQSRGENLPFDVYPHVGTGERCSCVV